MSPIPRFLCILAVAFASATLVAACGGGGNDDDLDDRADVADPKVRFVHAVPLGPDVSLVRDGNMQGDATDVGFLYASQYIDIGTGDTDFSLVTGPLDTELANTTIDANRGDKYTLVALPDGLGAELLVIEDPYNKSVASDDARLRVVNAAANADDVDVYVTAPGVDLDDVEPTIASVGYKSARPDSGDDSVDLEQGRYRLRITAAGSKDLIFSALVDVPENGDWLLVTVPEDDLTPADGAIRVLLVRSDDSDDATDVIETD